ncbi:hypothetical protein GGR54DRAFT_370208 [Hypoxylon sp. NC1633]|nr:hypothetical protein GGR54DRAFT_370208 [Hypoxylon sp. NC1633]
MRSSVTQWVTVMDGRLDIGNDRHLEMPFMSHEAETRVVENIDGILSRGVTDAKSSKPIDAGLFGVNSCRSSRGVVRSSFTTPSDQVAKIGLPPKAGRLFQALSKHGGGMKAVFTNSITQPSYRLYFVLYLVHIWLASPIGIDWIDTYESLDLVRYFWAWNTVD